MGSQPPDVKSNRCALPWHAVVAKLSGEILRGARDMSSPNYCNLCNRNVVPTKEFNWLLFIFLCGCFYLPFYWMAEKKCPICAGTNFGPAKSDTIARQ